MAKRKFQESVKTTAHLFSRTGSFERLLKKTGQQLLLPFYHAVSDTRPPHLKYLYEPRKVAVFKADLEFILKYFEPIDLASLIAQHKSGSDFNKPVFHLTFDDGLSDFYHVVAPYLKEKGIPATMFLNSDFIDNKEMLFRFKSSLVIDQLFQVDKKLKAYFYKRYGIEDDGHLIEKVLSIDYSDRQRLDDMAGSLGLNLQHYLNEHQPYLSSFQIEELIKMGFTIGAHSMDHPRFQALEEAEQLRQVSDSLSFIKSRFNLDYAAFSFPFTDDDLKKSLFEKMENLVDLSFGTAGLKRDSIPFNLQRIPMESDESGSSIIRAEYAYFRWKKWVNKNQIQRN